MHWYTDLYVSAKVAEAWQGQSALCPCAGWAGLLISAGTVRSEEHGLSRWSYTYPSPQEPSQFLPLLILYFLSRIGLNYKAGRCPILRYFSWGLGLLLTATTAVLFAGNKSTADPAQAERKAHAEYDVTVSCFLKITTSCLGCPGNYTPHPPKKTPACSESVWNAALLGQDYFIPKQNFLPVTVLMSAGLPSLLRGWWCTLAWLHYCQSSDALVLPHLHVLCVPNSCVVSHQVPVYQRPNAILGNCDCVFCQPSGHYVDTMLAVS